MNNLRILLKSLIFISNQGLLAKVYNLEYLVKDFNPDYCFVTRVYPG